MPRPHQKRFPLANQSLDSSTLGSTKTTAFVQTHRIERLRPARPEHAAVHVDPPKRAADMARIEELSATFPVYGRGKIPLHW
jgi:hypothetical protein